MLISKSVIKSVNLAYMALFAGIIVKIFNSIVNPIKYCVKIRQFRVAFIQLAWCLGKAIRKLKTWKNEFLED